MDPDADPDPAIFISDLQDVKKKFPKFFCLLLFEGTRVPFHNFLKIKSNKETKNPYATI
jgi:hypothetical protein